MKQIKLIGYPRAGVASTQPIGRCDLPSIVFLRYTYAHTGDIVGAGTGAGPGPVVLVSASPAPCSADVPLCLDPVRRPVPLRQARAVGIGDDAETKRARAVAAWLNADDADEYDRETVADDRELIAAGIADDNARGLAILRLCGGEAFARGLGAGFTSRGMAPRAARAVERARGVQPSRASIEAAAADATAAGWVWWSRFMRRVTLWVPSAPVEDELWKRSIPALACVAWRAAFASITRAVAGGRTGRRGKGSGLHTPAAELDQAKPAVDAASVAEWRAREAARARADDRSLADTRRARRRVVTWLSHVLGASRGGRGGEAARAQVRLLAWMLCGAPWARASRAARFASERAAVESFRAGRVWARLADAVAGQPCESDRALVSALRRVGQAVARAVRRQRSHSSGAQSFGVSGYAPARVLRTIRNGQGKPRGLRPVPLDSQRATTARARARLVEITIKAPPFVVRIDNPSAAVWARAVDARGQAVATARGIRARLNAARATRRAAWLSASKGLRSGKLR